MITYFSKRRRGTRRCFSSLFAIIVLLVLLGYPRQTVSAENLDLTDPSNSANPAPNIPSLATGLAPDANGNVTSGIAPANATTALQSPITVYPLTGLSPYDPTYYDAALTGGRHLSPVASNFKLLYRRYAVPQSFANSATDMQTQNGNVWTPNLQSGEEAYKGHFLQAVGNVNVHIMVYKNASNGNGWNEDKNGSQYGLSGTNSALRNLLNGNYGVMVRFKMEKGVNAAAISKAIVWDRAYFKLAIDVPLLAAYVSRIYIPMQFDHTVYLDQHHPNIFYLKVKGLPMNMDVAANTGLGSMQGVRGVVPYGTTHAAQTTGSQPQMPSTIDYAAYRKQVPAASNLTDNQIKGLVQQDLRDFQNNVKTYTGNTWERVGQTQNTFKENDYPLVPQAAQAVWKPGSKSQYDLTQPQYQVNSILDQNTVSDFYIWNPSQDTSVAGSGYSSGYPFTYSLLDVLFSLNSMGPSVSSISPLTNIISQDGFAGSCFVNFFIDMDKYDGNLDDHSPNKTLTKGYLMPSAQTNHQYNLSMDIIGNDQLVDPSPTSGVYPHNTPMDRALIKPTFYTDAHANDPGYLWKEAATPSNDAYFASIPTGMRWNQDPSQEGPGKRLYWADGGKVGGNVGFSVAMNSWNSYVSPFDWDNKMNIDTTDVSDGAGGTKPWEVVLLPPKNTPSAASLPTRDGSKSYAQRSATLDMAATGGLLASDLPTQSTSLPYPTYTPRKDTDVVSTSRFARVVNYYSNFETTDADPDPANWGNKPALNTPDQVYANTGTLAQTVKAMSADVKDDQGNTITTLPTVGNNFKDNLQVRYSGFMGDGAYIRPATLYVQQKRFMPAINLTNRTYNVTAAQLAKGITINGNWTANWLPAMAVSGKVSAGIGDTDSVTVGDLTDSNPGQTGTWTKTTNPDNSAAAPGPHAFAFTVNDQAAHNVPDSKGTLGIANSVGTHTITVRTTITYMYQGTQYTTQADVQQIINVVPDNYNQINFTKGIVTDPNEGSTSQITAVQYQSFAEEMPSTSDAAFNQFVNFASPYDTISSSIQPTDQIRMRTRFAVPFAAEIEQLKNFKVTVAMPKTNDPAHPYFTMNTAPGDDPTQLVESFTNRQMTDFKGSSCTPDQTTNPTQYTFTYNVNHGDTSSSPDNSLRPGNVYELLYTLNVPAVSLQNIPAQQVLRDTFTATTASGQDISLSSNAVYLNAGGDNTYGLLHVPDLNFGQVSSTTIGTQKELAADQEYNQYFEAFDNRAVTPGNPNAPIREPWAIYAQLGGFSDTAGGTRSITGSTIQFDYMVQFPPTSPTSGTLTAGGAPVKILERPSGQYPAGFR